MRFQPNFSFSLFAALALATPSFANTYVVDQHGSGDFTDLPPAIAAALPGDVLLVLGGTYSGFTLDKRLAILGEAPFLQIQIAGPVVIQHIYTGATTVLANVAVGSTLTVSDCARPIAFESVYTYDTLTVDACTDLRCSHCQFNGKSFEFTQDGHDALVITSSRVELGSTTVTGGWGGDQDLGLPCGFGGPGVRVLSSASQLHCYRSTLNGGTGGAPDCSFLIQQPGGLGGTALEVQLGTSALIAGTSANGVFGGMGSIDCHGGFVNGAGLQIDPGAAARESSIVISSILDQGTLETPSPADPSLEALGPAQAGSTTKFVVHAMPGATVDLILGRNATIVPSGSSAEDLLVVQQRVFHLGAAGANGTATYSLPISASYPKGFSFFAQAKVTFSPSDVRYTNSAPLVVR